MVVTAVMDGGERERERRQWQTVEERRWEGEGKGKGSTGGIGSNGIQYHSIPWRQGNGIPGMSQPIRRRQGIPRSFPLDAAGMAILQYNLRNCESGILE